MSEGIVEIDYDVLHEKCAVGAIVMDNDEQLAADLMYYVLYALQHRGVEASGISTLSTDGALLSQRQPGMVRDVYDDKTIRNIASNMAIGHNRYSTNGSKSKHLQPVQDEPIAFAMATNGNLPVTSHLETFLNKNNIRTADLNDSEMKALAIAQHIRAGKALPDAIELSSHLFTGSYSSVAMHDDMVVAFRDPMGIRPLEIGHFDGGYVIASETCALDLIDAEHERSVKPGEMVIITKDGLESRQITDGQEKLDIFEFVYFARPDSYLYGENVGYVRYRLGEQLAQEHPQFADNPNTLVVPVPETSVPIAEGFAKALDLDWTASSVVKNRYVGRTFMMQSQKLRQRHLRLKHSIIPEFVKGRDAIFVDDSIVRLNTAPLLAEQAFAAGAKSVAMLIGSPPVRYPDFYGIDTPMQSELAAANMTVEQMRDEINVKYLGFLSLSRMVEATSQPRHKFNLSAFTGEYPIDIGHHRNDLFTPDEMSYID